MPPLDKTNVRYLTFGGKPRRKTLLGRLCSQKALKASERMYVPISD